MKVVIQDMLENGEILYNDEGKTKKDCEAIARSWLNEMDGWNRYEYDELKVTIDELPMYGILREV